MYLSELLRELTAEDEKLRNGIRKICEGSSSQEELDAVHERHKEHCARLIDSFVRQYHAAVS